MVKRNLAISVLCIFTALIALSGIAYAGHIVRAGELEDKPDLQAISQGVAEKTHVALERKVVSVNAINVPAYAIILAIAEKAGIPVGLELLKDNKLVSVNITGGTVFGALDQVYSADKQYAYEAGGVLNYFVRGYYSPRAKEVGAKAALEPAKNIFNIKVDNLQIASKSPKDAVKQLFSLDVLKDKEPKLPVEVVDSANSNAGPDITYKFYDQTVRSMINMISMAAGKNWVVTVSDNKLKFKFFDSAASICPDVDKIQVDLE